MKVSVIIPAYNAQRWLPETLESVAGQDFPEMEVIIVDDGSTDDTAALVTQNWPQHTLIRTENWGVSHARNTGTAAATGEYIQYLDADDLLMPGKISRQVAMLLAHPEADVVYSNWQYLEQTATGEFKLGDTVARAIEDVSPDSQIAFFTGMWCPTGAYLYRRPFLHKVGEWKSWLPVIQDARFAWDCARANASWVHDVEASVLYRKHLTGSVSTKSKLAFQKDCRANTEDVHRLWAEEGTLNGGRLQAVITNYYNLTRAMFPLDEKVFDEIWQALHELAPDFRPPGAVFSVLDTFLGHRNAERVAQWYRQAKRLIASP